MDLINNVRVATIVKDVQYCDFYNSIDKSFTAAYGLRYKGIVFDVSFDPLAPDWANYRYDLGYDNASLNIFFRVNEQDRLKFYELIENEDITLIDLVENEPISLLASTTSTDGFKCYFHVTTVNYKLRLQFK